MCLPAVSAAAAVKSCLFHFVLAIHTGKNAYHPSLIWLTAECFNGTLYRVIWSGVRAKMVQLCVCKGAHKSPNQETCFGYA